jgi:hypothetical protein
MSAQRIAPGTWMMSDGSCSLLDEDAIVDTLKTNGGEAGRGGC